MALVLGSPLLWHVGARATSGPLLTLEVTPSAAEYDRAAQVVLDVRFTVPAASGGDVTVATHPVGTLCVRRAERDGTRLTPLKSDVSFLQDPLLAQAASLTTITPGTSVVRAVALPPEEGGGSLLTTVRRKRSGAYVALTYALTEPGSYTLQLCYQYKGPDDGRSGVWRGKLNGNEVTLRLR